MLGCELKVVANVTGALKSTALWDNTFLVFSSDNGAPGSGSNFPLRGYKLSNFEGGTRAAAFVSGGLLPPAVRGKPAVGLAGIYDWAATFIALAGAKTPATGIDGLNLWPWLSGATSASPRTEVVYMLGGRGALRDSRYKIIVGRCCPEGCASSTLALSIPSSWMAALRVGNVHVFVAWSEF